MKKCKNWLGTQPSVQSPLWKSIFCNNGKNSCKRTHQHFRVLSSFAWIFYFLTDILPRVVVTIAINKKNIGCTLHKTISWNTQEHSCNFETFQLNQFKSVFWWRYQMLTFKMFPGIRERNISGFTYVNKAVFLTP